MHRCLEGTWRKSGLPLALVRYHVEKVNSYDLAFKHVLGEFKRRKVQKPFECHTDWFPGLDVIVEKHFSHHVCDIEHMFKNIQKKGSPRINRPIGAVKSMIRALSTVPTWTLFHTLVNHWLLRVEFVYLSPRWSEYFRKVYLKQKTCRQEVHGLAEMTCANWWHGISGWTLRGYPPAWQQPEASNRQLKRCMGAGKQGLLGKNLVQIMEEVEKTVILWQGPARDQEQKSYTLQSDTYRSTPGYPDVAMWQEAQTVHQPGHGTVTLPSIQQILDKQFYVKKNSSRGCFYYMTFGTPAVISDQTVSRMIAQTRCHKPDEMESLLKEHGILNEEQCPQAPLKIDYDELIDLWSNHCMVKFEPGASEDSYQCACSCWYHVSRGHCTHAWSVCVLEKKMSFPEVLPSHEEAQAMAEIAKEERTRSMSANRRPKRRKSNSSVQSLAASPMNRGWRR